MSETQSIARMVFALIVLVLLVTLIAAQPPDGLPPGSLPPANTNLSSLQTAAAESFPVFNNPFTAVTTSHLPVVANGSVLNAGTWFPEPPAHEVGCTLAGYWNCVTSADANTSYVNSTPLYSVAFNLSSDVGGGGQYAVADFRFDYQCRSSSSSPWMEFVLFQTDGTLLFDVRANDVCASSSWGNGTSLFQTDYPVALSAFSALTLSIQFNGIDLSYVTLFVDFTHTQVCSGGGLFSSFDAAACAMMNLARTVFDGILFFLNGVIFLAQVVVWFLTMVANLVVLVVGSIVWIATIPGTPPLVSGVVLGLIASFLIVVVLALAGLIRGREP